MIRATSPPSAEIDSLSASYGNSLCFRLRKSRIFPRNAKQAIFGRAVLRYDLILAQPTPPPSVGKADVMAHDCLIFASRNQRQGWRFRGEGGPWVKAQGRSRLRLDSVQAIRDAALAGLGIALLPDFLVADDLVAGRLQQVLPSLETADAKIVALYPDKRLLEPRVRRFIDLMVEELGDQGQARNRDASSG